MRATLLATLALAPPFLAPARAPELVEQRTHLATGIDARWVELGAPDGPLVLFLHGYTDSSRSFVPTMRALSALRPELRLVALDQRGHGGSSLPPGADCAQAPERCFGVDDFAADALALLDLLGAERACVVGHSLGSAVAQELALDHPERVERTVWIATSARFAHNPAAERFLRDELVEGAWKRAAEERGLAFPGEVWSVTPLELVPDVEAWLRANWAVERGADPELLEEIARDAAQTPLGTWIGTLRALLELDQRERLADLRVPTLVIWPVQDAFFPLEPDQRELRQALRCAAKDHGTPWTWKQYGSAPLAEPSAPQTDFGHNLIWSAPERVARDLAEFLAPRE